MRRLGLTQGAAVLSAALLGASLWLPWVRLGGGTRTSFGAFRSAQRLGLDDLAPLRVAWFLVPVLAFAVGGLAALGFRRSTVVGLMTLALLVGAPAVLIVVSGQAAWGPGYRQRCRCSAWPPPSN